MAASNFSPRLHIVKIGLFDKQTDQLSNKLSGFLLLSPQENDTLLCYPYPRVVTPLLNLCHLLA